jgi:GABA(A) receptor-associated protein
MSNLVLKKEVFTNILQKYPGRLPVFITKAHDVRDIPDLPKHKYLFPSHFTVGELIYVIRKQLVLPPEKAIFVFINNTIPTSSSTVGEIYALHQSPDGALRVSYTTENTFGSSACSSSFYSSLPHLLIY